MSASCTPRAACLTCAADLPAALLSLGLQPLANALLDPASPPEDEPRYPLELVFCARCSLAQLAQRLPPERLFREYRYFSSYSDSFVAHARALAERLTRERGLGPASLVLEAASNDGYLLRHYRALGVEVLGIEPARNVALAARAAGVPTLDEFFDEALAGRLASAGRLADVVHAHNVLAHVPDPRGFLRGLRRLLQPDGLAVVEVPYVRDLLERCAFDTIYHEHLAYFSFGTLASLLRDAGLEVRRVERLGVHGGSLRLLAGPGAEPDASVPALLDEERVLGLERSERYAAFAAQVQQALEALRGELLARKRAGRRLAAYGAAAKGTVLLNCLDLPAGTLDFVADRSPHKQGRLVPGVRLPIRSPQALLDDQPDDVLLLAWNLEDEVLAQQQEYRRRGGTFLVPLPRPRVVPPPAQDAA